jgi:hypothetical protein
MERTRQKKVRSNTLGIIETPWLSCRFIYWCWSHHCRANPICWLPYCSCTFLRAVNQHFIVQLRRAKNLECDLSCREYSGCCLLASCGSFSVKGGGVKRSGALNWPRTRIYCRSYEWMDHTSTIVYAMHVTCTDLATFQTGPWRCGLCTVLVRSGMCVPS